MWKNFWKSSIGLGDIASWNVLMFLKIVKKWREIKKSKLNNSLTDWVFEKIFSHLFLSRHVLSKLFICFAIPWNFNFAVNLVTSFSRQKPLKSKNKKHRIFWNTEFYHPAKFELKRIKNAKVVTTLQLFACVLAQREGVTGGYRGLQGVTNGYRGLQRVTRSDRGWQRVTGGYNGL